MAIYDIDNLPAKLLTGDIVNCPYKDTEKSITLPIGKYKLECWGAKGGNATSSRETRQGGNGGYSVGQLIIQDPLTLYLYCGGAGQNIRYSDTTFYNAYNGGGKGRTIKFLGVVGTGGGGGGATHISTMSGLLSELSNHRSDVLLVAGGGGGGYTRGYLAGRYGGVGGGLSGGIGDHSSDWSDSTMMPGTQSSPGNNAGFGYGADTNDDDYRGGAGGSGWYGGSAGYSNDSGGSGGSGYISNKLTEASTTQEVTSTNPDTTNHAGYIRITMVSSLYSFSASSNSPLINTVVSASTGYKGDTITFTANVAPNIEWDGWYQGTKLVSTSRTYSTVVDTADIYLVARGKCIISYKTLFETLNDRLISADTGLTPDDLPELPSYVGYTFAGWYYNARTITNLLPGASGFTLSNAYLNNAIITYQSGVSIISMALCNLPVPIAGHKYYGRVEQRIPAGTIILDDRFEYYYSDAPNGTMVFARFSDSTYDGMWHTESSIQTLPSVISSTGWSCRSFAVNSTSEVQRRNMMIVDLTEAFGAGNEPSKDECDEYFEYFIGTIPYDNFADKANVGDILLQNTNLYGKWSRANRYTITYNTPYGKIEDKVIYEDQAITEDYLPNNLTQRGYKLQSWYYDKRFIQPVQIGDYITSNTIFYAKWLKVSTPVRPNINELTVQAYRNIDINILILDYNFDVIDEISGIVESASFDINADSDIRRTANISMILKSNYTNTGILNDVYFQAGNGYWFDKYINIQIGIEDNYYREYGWYKQGIYLINEPSISYDATNNSLSFQAVDLMSKMTGLRNGQLEGQTHSILAVNPDGTPTNNTITNTISSLLKEQNFDKSVILTPDINIIPQDIIIDAGGTTYDLLSQLRDINSNWEMFFDANGVFYFQQIPTGRVETVQGDVVYEEHPAVVVDDSFWDKLLISYQLNTNFADVKNYIEVYGKSYDINNMIKAENINYGVHSITCTVPDEIILDDGLYHDIIVSFGDSQNQPEKLYSAYQNIVITNADLTIRCKPHIKYYNVDYLIRVSKNLTDNTWNLEYLGYLQPQAVAWENNPKSPFYVGDVLNVEPEPWRMWDEKDNGVKYYIGDKVTWAEDDINKHYYICIKDYPADYSGDIFEIIWPDDEEYWEEYTMPTPFFERWDDGVTYTHFVGDIVYYNQALWMCIKSEEYPQIPNEKYEEYWMKLNSIDAIYGQMPTFEKMVRGVCTGGDYDNQPTNQTVLELSAYELYNRCRLHDTITITCVPIYSLDVNQLISITLPNENQPSYWLIKNVSTNFSPNGTQNITAVRYYPDYPIFGKRYDDFIEMLPEDYTNWKWVGNNTINLAPHGTKYLLTFRIDPNDTIHEYENLIFSGDGLNTQTFYFHDDESMYDIYNGWNSEFKTIYITSGGNISEEGITWLRDNGTLIPPN